MICQELAEIQTIDKLEFRSGFDDLNYLVFATLTLPSGDRISLIHRDNSLSGTEICVKPDLENIPTVLQQAMTEMN